MLSTISLLLIGDIWQHYLININNEALVQGIIESGFGLIDNFISPAEVTDLRHLLVDRLNQNEFKKAGIGKTTIRNEEIRGDYICWLNTNNLHPAEQAYFDKVNAIRQFLNETCYLGVHEFECHYAFYHTGSFYKRHLDRFKADTDRKISIITYLHDDWQPDDGGQLVLHHTEGPEMVLPLAGRMLCFKSGELEHEVKPASRPRMSITGWLKG